MAQTLAQPATTATATAATAAANTTAVCSLATLVQPLLPSVAEDGSSATVLPTDTDTGSHRHLQHRRSSLLALCVSLRLCVSLLPQLCSHCCRRWQPTA